jgi:hypothetical protein
MSNVIDLPVEFLTEEDRVRDRWVTLGFAASVIAGKPAETQKMFLREALKKFADVPDMMPSSNDTLAFATFAAKLLLEALAHDTGIMAETTKLAMDKFCKDTGLFR